MNIEQTIHKAKNNDFLLGLLFINLAQSDVSDDFYVYSQYTNSVILENQLTEEEIVETNTQLSQKTNGNWVRPISGDPTLRSLNVRGGKKHFWHIPNPNNKSYLSVYNEILKTVRSKTNINVSDFLAGAFSCRASLDQNRECITIDYWYRSGKYELETKTRALLNLMPLDALSAVFPINFRELQEDYQNGTQRETQFRIRANWFSSNSYLINPYKQRQLDKISNALPVFQNCTSSPELLSRVQAFSNIIYDDHDIANENIEQYRQRLGFDSNTSTSSIRNRRLVDFAWELLPDECASCSEIYAINDRTFPSKKRGGRPYLEIHHIISLGSEAKLDAEFNLSKLCPACHTSLSRGRSTPEYQRQIIQNILDFSSTDTDSIQQYLEISNPLELAEKIQERLL